MTRRELVQSFVDEGIRAARRITPSTRRDVFRYWKGIALDCAQVAHILKKGGAKLEDGVEDLGTIRRDVARGLKLSKASPSALRAPAPWSRSTS